MTTDTNTLETQDKSSPRWTDLRRTLPQVLPRLRDLFVYAIGQVRIYQKIYPGIMHALIFWGVTIQVIGTAINLQQMDLFIPYLELPFPRGTWYLVYELAMDLAGLAILIGVAMAAFRRIVLRPKALETEWDDYYALVILGIIPIIGFTVEATRLIAASPPWAVWSPIGNMYAGVLRNMGVSPEMAFSLRDSLVWFHATIALLLLASIPFTKMRHLFTAPLNILLYPRRKEGTLEKIDDIEETEILGVGKVSEFNSYQLLSFDACTQCGRCEEVCPATISGMTFTPRAILRSLREAMDSSLVYSDENSNAELIGNTIPEDQTWSCTTCGACIYRCPVFINPVDDVIDLRRYQTLSTGKLPKSIADTLRNFERQGNPWGMPPEQRVAWAEGLGIRVLNPGEETDVLLYLGCAAAFDDRNKKVTKSFIRLLQMVDVDFAILGLDETCCGDTARRLGHEYLFQVFAEQNIDIFNQVKFNRIVTQCPHCFNTLKNEYPQLGGNFRVQHYSEYLNELSLHLEINSHDGNGKNPIFTYHDPCYIGRYNQIYSQPRKLLSDAHIKIVEMTPNTENSFCCGGGGGQMWLETEADTRINHQRLNDALQVQSDVVATACPYCLLMFDDAIRSKGIGDQIEVMDISEILEHQLSNSGRDNPQNP